MKRKKPMIELGRMEVGTLLAALTTYHAECAMEAQVAIEAKRHVPGEAAGYAMAGADATELKAKLEQYAVDQGWLTRKPTVVK